MQLKYEILPENLKVLEIKQIFLNKDKFGALTFDRSYEIAHSTRKLLVELIEHNYKDLLTPSEVLEINNDVLQLLDLVKKVSNTDPETDPNFNLNIRNSLEDEIIRVCEDIQRRLRDKLVYLRQELSLSSPGDKDLQEEKKELSKIRIEYEKTLFDLQKKVESLTLEKQTIENTQGEIAATRFGKYFESQSEEYEKDAGIWLKKRESILLTLYIIIVINAIIYLYLFFANKVKIWPNFPPEDFFTTQYLLIKAAGILLLSHVLAFNSKNFSINKNLSAKNKHRKNVSDTVSSFLESNSDTELKSQIIKQGTESMFKLEETGYLGKLNEKGHSPMEQITYIVPNTKT